jgi:hypothetical protein
MVEAVARRYRVRPSEILGIPPDDPLALDVDTAMAMIGSKAEQDAWESARAAAEAEYDRAPAGGGRGNPPPIDINDIDPKTWGMRTFGST